MNVNLPVESSNPKKPTLAAVAAVSYQLNSIPRSLLSSAAGALAPPNVNIGSSTVIVLEFTEVVVPLICKLPAITTVPVTPEGLGSRYKVLDESEAIVEIVLPSILTLPIVNT